MSASQDRRRNTASSEDGSQDLPRIAAAFLIVFDQKIGYTIAWKRCLPEVQLDGVVEYKSLPSGLHNVKEDLVYFIHDSYAGLSAFVNGPAAQAERNARLVAVGVLVPLSYGRLAGSWEYAEELRHLAATLISDIRERGPLEDFWEEHRIAVERSEQAESSSSSSGVKQGEHPGTKGAEGHRRPRAVSDVATSRHGDNLLPSTHPALSIVDLLDTFGPLLFPLHRAALLRKRILIVGTAPVQLACEYVYDLSILSNIPLSTTDILPPDSQSLFRLRPLFSVGVQDIPFLGKQAAPASKTSSPQSPNNAGEEAGDRGWIACTTDEVLAMKRNLYDIIVKLPSITEHKPNERSWPRILTAEQQDIKSTQRDLRRYQTLRADLGRLRVDSSTRKKARRRPSPTVDRYRDDPPSDTEDQTGTGEHSATDDHAPLLPGSHSDVRELDDPSILPPSDLIEQTSWSALAYDSFMWWASAGERSLDLQEEQQRDHALFGDVALPSPQLARPSSRPRSSSGQSKVGPQHKEDTGAVREMSIIAYFHRLTHGIFETIAEIVDAVDEGEDAGNSSSSYGNSSPGPAVSTIPLHPQAEVGTQKITTGAGVPNSSPHKRLRGEGNPQPNPRNRNEREREREQHPDPEAEVVIVTSEDMARMGLDDWSEADRAFVKELVGLYWRRKGEVRMLPRVECCGVRIC